MLPSIAPQHLVHITGGAQVPPDPSVAYCKNAYARHQITNADVRAFGNDLSYRGYRGHTPQAAACFAKASTGGFGFSKEAVMKTFGIDPAKPGDR